MSSTIGNSYYGEVRNSFSNQCLYALCFVVLITNNFIDAFVTHRIRPGCELVTNVDWSKTQALILNKDMTKIIHPSSQDSVLLAPTEEVVLACPGSRLVLKPEQETVASCSRGTQMQVGEKHFDFSSMTCKKSPVTSTRTVGRCLKDSVNGKHVEIGFKVDKNFIQVLEICFDDKLLSSVYSHYVATPNIVGGQHGVSRPQFKEAGFYHDVKVAQLYSTKSQKRTFAAILGSDELGEKYIQDDNLHYLARGHLSAKADFIYGAEQMGTFYYINVAPQWQIINGGNWAALEKSVRNYVADTNSEMSVYTLPYDIAQLPDINDNLQQLYIYKKHTDNDNDSDNDDDYYDTQDDDDDDDDNDNYNENISNYENQNLIPVPKFYIKLLYNEEKKTGVGFVTINNPYLQHITDDYILCDDVCNKYPWLKWDADNIELGYSYCCTYDELKKTVKTLPHLPIEELL